jgi:hypothetical protein
VKTVKWELLIRVISAVHFWVGSGCFAEHVSNFDVNLTEKISRGIRSIHIVDLEGGVLLELPELEVLLEVPCWVHTGILDNMSSNNLIVWWDLILASWSLKEHGNVWISLGEGILTLSQVCILNVHSDGLRVVINALPSHKNWWGL